MLRAASKPMTGEVLQQFLRIMYVECTELDEADIAVHRIIMDIIVKTGEFDCDKYEIVDGIMHYPSIANADKSVVAVISWAQIPFLLRRKE